LSLLREEIPHLFDLFTVIGGNEKKIVNVLAVAAYEVVWIHIVIAEFCEIQQLPALQKKRNVVKMRNKGGQPSRGTGIVPLLRFDEKRWAATPDCFNGARNDRLLMSFNIDLYHRNIRKCKTVEG